MIEAVLFDFGGVVTTSPFDNFATYERDVGLPEGLIRSINATNPDDNAWAKLERSEVDRDGFVALFEAEAAALGHAVDARRVLDCLKTQLRPGMVSVVRGLRPRYKTAILTNNLRPHGDDPDDGLTPTGDMGAVTSDVDALVESSVVGCRKPEVRFYEIACDALGVDASACVFLDDLGVNCKPARAMGMTTIKVTGEAQAIADLEAVLGHPVR